MTCVKYLNGIMKIIDKKFLPLNFVIAIVSDTRNESTDKSGMVLEKKIQESGHFLINKVFIKDEKVDIKKFFLNNVNEKKVNVIISTGGTGLTGRDSTPEVLKKIIDKEIPGFGELFRMISYKKIGTSAIQSRALGGIKNGKFLFSIPGSPSACKDAWDNIFKFQFDNRFKPCNLSDLIPRLNEK